MKWSMGLSAIWGVVLSATIIAAQIPIPAGFPNGTTTGPIGAGLSYGDLTASGGITISADNTVIEKLDISGGVSIKADNITIRQCRITSPGIYAVTVDAGTQGLTLEYCELVGTQYNSAAMVSFDTIRYCDISRFQDGLKMSGNSVIENNYIHDLYHEPGMHNDGVQNSGNSSNIIFRNNTVQALYQTQTAAIKITTNTGPIDNILIEGNFLSGGSYTVYVTDKGNGHGPPTNITFKNNVWEWDSWARKPDGVTIRPTAYIVYDGTPAFDCNRFHTGELIAQNPICTTGIKVSGIHSSDGVGVKSGQTILYNIIGRNVSPGYGAGIYLLTIDERSPLKKVIHFK
jgi:hypothetical protein